MNAWCKKTTASVLYTYREHCFDCVEFMLAHTENDIIKTSSVKLIPPD